MAGQGMAWHGRHGRAVEWATWVAVRWMGWLHDIHQPTADWKLEPSTVVPLASTRSSTEASSSR